ncbi:invertebrate-type lysozyme-like [Ruditapes philippinarum]|uniref:invertebrate-type lysozyme-like n=1 Tax=Ruditapes philippinarum TaxID=129788 RepID=UPI00295B15A5|nr:invertebrate-type lysozyme-like [Ruditapes philippinarum]
MMVGIQALWYLCYIICSVYTVICLSLEVNQVIKESTNIDNVVNNANPSDQKTESESNNQSLAGGQVSIDCLRCLCLERSDCRPIGCVMVAGTLGCGFFRFTNAFWIDCYEPGGDWRTCANDLHCASHCVQVYMNRYAANFSCFLNCEGYARELAGGPNGCNNPRTIAYWEKVQTVPGCKGVQ